MKTSFAYAKCSNPSCEKLNPVYGNVFPDREYNCVFCGSPFKTQTRKIVETVEKTRPTRKKKGRQIISRPQNRNLRKPMR
jgi:hypothetical protein